MKNTLPHEKYGAKLLENGRIHFSLWAPYAKTVELNILSPFEKKLPMEHKNNGIFEISIKDPLGAIDYTYTLDKQSQKPDPTSHWQPFGIDNPSRVCIHQYDQWSDGNWCGIELEDMIIYELHVGTFTSEGTFEGIIKTIPHLKNLGINTIELMPIATFSGKRNWGYDGVQLYAPQESYGGPKGLKHLVDACHKEGIAVLLDVVYNHLGPEGNYLNSFGPYFTKKYSTPWGEAINYDGEYSTYVRQFFIENALYWLEYYHIDGLRLDAIHGIFDQSAYHFLEELKDEFYKKAESLKRKAYLIAESDLNDPKYLKEKAHAGYGLDAQWNDDFHHSLHSYITKNKTGYFEDYGTLEQIAKAVTQGFVYDGQWSEFRKRHHGRSSSDIPGFQMVSFIQNHDQIANASQGRKLSTLVSNNKYLLSSALLLLSPSLPLLFMGQEWGANEPFYFFTDFHDTKLQEAVKLGRVEEYSSMDIAEGFHDPGDIETYNRCKLDWNWINSPEKVNLFKAYQKLIFLRKNHPALNNCNKNLTHIKYDEERQYMIIERNSINGDSCTLLFNFSEKTILFHTNEYIDDKKRLYTTSSVSEGYGDEDHITLSPFSFSLYDCSCHYFLNQQSAVI